MSDFMRSIPITPDMVSLWVPSGLNRAQDLIRGNHGQCYGTHPNVPVISKPVGANLLVNGSFTVDKDPPDDWTANASALLTTEAGGRVGNCLLITENGAANPFATQIVSVTPGKTYKATCYVKRGTEATYRLQLYDFSNSTIIYNTGLVEEAAGDWSTSVTHTFKAPTGCVQVKIYLYNNAASGSGKTLYYDEITLYEIKPSLINPSVGWHFDGTNDKVTVVASQDFALEKMTFSAWINADVFPSSKGIINLREDANNTFLIRTGQDDDTLHIRIKDGGVTKVSLDTPILSAQIWNHIAFTQNGTEWKFYLNRELSTLTGTNDACCTDHLTINYAYLGYVTAANNYFNGYIALPFVANKSWSIAQIENFYNATKGMFAPRG